MQKQTKFIDVVHFYVGVKIYMPSTQVLRMIGLAKNITGCNIILLDNNCGQWTGLSDKHKPLLRPLSSITDIEALELGKLATGGMVENVSRIDRNELLDRAEIFYSNTTEKIDLHTELISWLEECSKGWVELPIHNYGQVMLYLTQNSFDIFGLIKNMQALKLE